MKKKFRCEVDCAACASKVEDAMRKVDGVIDVKVNFLTVKLTLEAEDARFDEVLAAAVKAGKKAEADFSVEI